MITCKLVSSKSSDEIGRGGLPAVPAVGTIIEDISDTEICIVEEVHMALRNPIVVLIVSVVNRVNYNASVGR